MSDTYLKEQAVVYGVQYSVQAKAMAKPCLLTSPDPLLQAVGLSNRHRCYV